MRQSDLVDADRHPRFHRRQTSKKPAARDGRARWRGLRVDRSAVMGKMKMAKLPQAAISWFAELGIAHRPTVGGKAASLGELLRAGAPVPLGFVVTSARLFDGADRGEGQRWPGARSDPGLAEGRHPEGSGDVDADTGLAARRGDQPLAGQHLSGPAGPGHGRARIPHGEVRGRFRDPVPDAVAALDADRRIRGRIDALADAEKIETTCREIREELEGADLLAELRTAISEAYGRLCGHGEQRPVAVRSSATSEDQSDASFAGLQDTLLWIRGLDDVVAAIKRCWSSLYSVKSVTYRLRLSLPEDHVVMAVAVQQMVIRHYGHAQDTEWAIEAHEGEDPKIPLLQARPETVWSSRDAEKRSKVELDRKSTCACLERLEQPRSQEMSGKLTRRDVQDNLAPAP